MQEVQQFERFSQSPCIGTLMSLTYFVFDTISGVKWTEEVTLLQHAISVEVSSYGVALNTPIKCGSDARLGGVHFYGPPVLSPWGFFWVFFG